jgi:hypothetical protein
MFDSTVTNAKSNWLWKNKIFIISLSVHVICIGIAVALLCLHKFWWEASYNINVKATELNPITHKKSWDNPYCD